MLLKFFKMQSAGNDFIIIDNRKKNIKNPKRLSKILCRRKFSVGADGLLLINNSPTQSFYMKYYNSDGSPAEFCGNGARCIAYIARYLKIIKDDFEFYSDAGSIQGKIIDFNKGIVKIKMPIPVKFQDIELKIKNTSIKGSFIEVGVPHFVIFLDNLNIDVNRIGREIRYHKKFQPAGTNVNFVKVLNKKNILLRTYERGVETETYACGTGAVASCTVAKIKNFISNNVNIKTSGNEILKVYIERYNYEYIPFLEGKVNLVYTGNLVL